MRPAALSISLIFLSLTFRYMGGFFFINQMSGISKLPLQRKNIFYIFSTSTNEGEQRTRFTELAKSKTEVKKKDRLKFRKTYDPIKRELRITRFEDIYQSKQWTGRKGKLKDEPRMWDVLFYARNKESKKSLEALARVEELDLPITLKDCNVLMKELGNNGDLISCERVLELMDRKQISPCMVSYTTLISRAGSWQKPWLAEKYFRAMLTRGIKPDLFVYNSLINAHSKAGDALKGLRCAEAMAAEGLVPDVVTYNTLMDTFVRSGNLTGMHQIQHKMEASGVRPDLRTFGTMINAYSVAGNVTQALKLLRQMREEGLRPNDVIYSSILHALGSTGKLEEAFRLLSLMKAEGVLPNAVTLSSLIHWCGKFERLELGVCFFEEMRRSEDPRCRPNTITCSSLVDLCLKSGQVDRAIALLGDMREMGIPLNQVTYTSFISELTKLGRIDRINDIFPRETSEETYSLPVPSHTESSGSKPAEYEPKLSQSRQDPQEGVPEGFPFSVQSRRDGTKSPSNSMRQSNEPFEGASDVGITFATGAYGGDSLSVEESLIEGRDGVSVGLEREKAGFDWESKLNEPESESVDMGESVGEGTTAEKENENQLYRLHEVFQEMRRSGVKPDTGVFNTLINTCAECGDLARAVEVLSSMRHEGLQPDVITYTCLIKACCAHSFPRRSLLPSHGTNQGNSNVTMDRREDRQPGPEKALELAEDLFLSMQQRTNHFSDYVAPNELTYRFLMLIHLDAAHDWRMRRSLLDFHVQRIWDLYEEMKERGIPLRVGTFGLLMKTAQLGVDVDRGLEVLEDIRRSRSVHFDYTCWQIAASMCAWAGRHQEETFLRSEMSQLHTRFRSFHFRDTEGPVGEERGDEGERAQC